jgi:hypothetical protein
MVNSLRFLASMKDWDESFLPKLQKTPEKVARKKFVLACFGPGGPLLLHITCDEWITWPRALHSLLVFFEVQIRVELLLLGRNTKKNILVACMERSKVLQ